MTCAWTLTVPKWLIFKGWWSLRCFVTNFAFIQFSVHSRHCSSDTSTKTVLCGLWKGSPTVKCWFQPWFSRVQLVWRRQCDRHNWKSSAGTDGLLWSIPLRALLSPRRWLCGFSRFRFSSSQRTSRTPTRRFLVHSALSATWCPSRHISDVFSAVLVPLAAFSWFLTTFCDLLDWKEF